MTARLSSAIGSLSRHFLWQSGGSVAPLLALALVPIIGSVGAAVDFSRASDVRAKLQAAVDAAVIAGAHDGTANWTQTALNVFNG
jgi:Flp pilus assembly protein TadG